MPNRILRTPADLDSANIRAIFAGFDLPITNVDCGQMCAPYNPSRKPFCCDICHAVPAAYTSEWATLRPATDLWHLWRGDECSDDEFSASHRIQLESETPNGMLLLACLGPHACERENRLISCRQFPFFPYVTSDGRFLGLAYDWEFEMTCWVISNLARVTSSYRQQFIHTYDRLFALFDEEFESYALRSEEMRELFAELGRRIPLLHRNGGYHLISSRSERARRVDASCLKDFGVYQNNETGHN